MIELALPTGEVGHPEGYLEHPIPVGENMYLVGHEYHHRFDANSYLLRTAKGNILFDCGSSDGMSSLLNNLSELGEPVDAIFGTHAHRDHLDAVSQLKKELSSPFLVLPEKSIPILESGDYDLTASFLYERPFHPSKADDIVRDGNSFNLGSHTIEVIETPGHSPDSTSYLVTSQDQQSYLFSGDTIWGHGHASIGSDYTLWKKSLLKLAERDFSGFFSGHAPSIGLPHSKDTFMSHIESFGQQFSPGFRSMVDPWQA